MDTTELQSKAKSFSHLLPSQTDWLERLLFQLAFNDIRQLQTIGGQGSGKSTLALVLAELFSSQYNVALISGTPPEQQVSTLLMQQWFGLAVQLDKPLLEQVESQHSTSALLIIIDDTERYSPELLRQLTALPAILFCFASQNVLSSALTLTLNRITSADAQQLLKHEAINPLAVAERLAAANGNLNRLLDPTLSDINKASSAASEAIKGTFGNRHLYVAGFGLVLMLAVAIYVFSGYLSSTDTLIVETEVALQPANKDSVISSSPVLDDVPDDEHKSTNPALTTEQAVEQTFSDTKQQAESAVKQVQETASVLTSSDDEGKADEVVLAEEQQDTNEATVEHDESGITEGVLQNDTTTNTDSTVLIFKYDELMLQSLPRDSLVLQLAVFSNDTAQARFIQSYPQLKLLSYVRSWQGKSQIVVLIAPFADTVELNRFRIQLPAPLLKAGPFSKSVKSVQAEIDAYQISQQRFSVE